VRHINILLLFALALLSDTVASKLLIFEADVGQDGLVSTASRELGAEETIHGLERDALGLGYKEKDEYGCAEHE